MTTFLSSLLTLIQGFFTDGWALVIALLSSLFPSA
jgi:hypothetical protein